MANRPLKLKSGRTLDDDLVAKLASEAERGYDLRNAKRVILRTGRPGRGEPTGESPRVTSRVPDGIYTAAKQRAKEEGLTVSEVVRALLTAYAAGRSPVMTSKSSERRMAARTTRPIRRRRLSR